MHWFSRNLFVVIFIFLPGLSFGQKLTYDEAYMTALPIVETGGLGFGAAFSALVGHAVAALVIRVDV